MQRPRMVTESFKRKIQRLSKSIFRHEESSSPENHPKEETRELPTFSNSSGEIDILVIVCAKGSFSILSDPFVAVVVVAILEVIPNRSFQLTFPKQQPMPSQRPKKKDGMYEARFERQGKYAVIQSRGPSKIQIPSSRNSSSKNKGQRVSLGRSSYCSVVTKSVRTSRQGKGRQEQARSGQVQQQVGTAPTCYVYKPAARSYHPSIPLSFPSSTPWSKHPHRLQRPGCGVPGHSVHVPWINYIVARMTAFSMPAASAIGVLFVSSREYRQNGNCIVWSGKTWRAGLRRLE